MMGIILCVNEIVVVEIFMTDWNIQTRAHGCESCGNGFAGGQAYHTLLFDEKTGLRRSDVCGSCWDRQYAEARGRKGFISCWQGVYEAPPRPSDPIERETAETLLRKLIEQNDPQYIPAGYILAVMLERKRLMKVKEQIVRDGRRVFLYEQPATGDLFTIADPNLRLDQLDQVQRDVAALLEHGLNPPASPGAPAAGEPGRLGESAPADPGPAAEQPQAAAQSG